MKRKFGDILTAVDNGTPLGTRAQLRKAAEESITALRYDSRLATINSAFFCLVGKTADGHDYARAAYRNGCRLFVVERPLALPPDAFQLQVPDTRVALADCSAEFYGHPERSMRLIGLTGTKGKTTTAVLIRSLLEDAGIPAGYIGTNGVDYLDFHHQTVNSTPESAEIYRYLRYMLDEGVKVCVLEVSSQALWMGRTRGLRFDTVLFSNLSRDHIGGVEHPDFEHYRDCKRKLFTDYPIEAIVANRDDPHTPFMTEGATVPVHLYSTQKASTGGESEAVWLAEDRSPTVWDGRIGVSFTARCHGAPLPEPCFLPMPGDFNLSNALAALTVVCERFGVEPRTAVKSLERAVVPGRFETVTHPALPGVTFVIDYAHNGVSLTSILDALAAYRPKRLICLFGSVGGRSKERRRDLALAAAHRCQLCILTADNPGCEYPEEIIAEIDAAFPEDACPRVAISDRAEAIRYAVNLAEEGDIILLAGKGHERYQLMGVRRLPFSELAILREALQERAGETVY